MYVEVMYYQENGTGHEEEWQLQKCQPHLLSISDVYFTTAAPITKPLQSSTGFIHESTKCVWWCNTETTKLISYDHPWAAFKSPPVVLEDQILRDSINCLIDFAADQPYALQVRSYHKCWLKYLNIFVVNKKDWRIYNCQSCTMLYFVKYSLPSLTISYFFRSTR